jgi:DNA-binding LacI/PurR family transcriptional regulator
MKSWRREELRERLEEMIRAEGLWGKRLPADRKVAAELGANRRTLQKALADLEAEGLIERRHGSGTWVRERERAAGNRRTGRLAIIADRHYEDEGGWQYQAEMIRGALAQGRRLKSECTVLALDRALDREDESARVWDARAMRSFTGFILVSIGDRLLVRHLLDLRRGPVVLVDRTLLDMPVTSVLDGTFDGMRAVVRHLVHLGHRRIAFFHERGLALVNDQKFDGYRSGLQSGGIDLDERLLACPQSPQPKEKYAERAVEELLGLESPPTAIVASRDHRALTLIEALGRRGLQVGRDISVAGFGDTAIRMGLGDQLTSCRIYPRKFGGEAVRAALEPASPSEGRTIIVPDRLMIRSSTAAPQE